MDISLSPSRPLNQFLTPHLPPHCTSTNDFLTLFSSTFHTCIPTPLAFASTVLGCLSILSWLFAQLPQIIKNHRLKSTSGLSIYFLAEWCLGDLTNLLGCLLTGQATWQVIIGAYYCFVDLALVGQWIWFEGLGRGHAVKRVWMRVRRRNTNDDSDPNGASSSMQQVLEGVDPSPGERRVIEPPKAQDIPNPKDSIFHIPTYGSFRSSKEELSTSSSGTSNSHTIHNIQSQGLPSPSPRTVLLISMTLCLASTGTSVSATPTPIHINNTPAHDPSPNSTYLPLHTLGTLLSWTSTTLYLLSRLPQLYKNFLLRSTAGLSPLLFAAAFAGNLFYSSSLLLNPNLWHNSPAHGQNGWTGPNGNNRTVWTLNALPFFLGAAGVLVMDAGIGVQFWLWGHSAAHAETGPEAQELLISEERNPINGKRRWKEVHGWMRGWVPSGRLSVTRWGSSSTLGSEGQALLRGREERR